MTTAKLKFVAMSVTLLALAAGILWQKQQRMHLIMELATLREEAARSKAVGQHEASAQSQPSAEQPLTQDQFNELLRLRGQVAVLRAELAQASNVALKATRPLRELELATAEAMERYREELVPRTTFARDWMLAFRRYAIENQGQFPTNFDQAAAFLSTEHPPPTNVANDEFEVVYRGSLNDLTNQGDNEIIVLRERQVRHRYDGKWGRIYGLADGVSLQRFLETEDALEQWERGHMRATANQ